MISSLKHPATFLNGCETIRTKSSSLPSRNFPAFSALLPPSVHRQTANVSSSKPLYLSKFESFQNSERFSCDVDDHRVQKRDLTITKAYEADKSIPIEVPETPSEAAPKLKIGIYFATWWGLNVVFNIYNKKVLNAYPFPWLTSTLSLAAGSLIMLVSWGLRIAEAPQTDFDFWKALFPVEFYLHFHMVWVFKLACDLGFPTDTGNKVMIPEAERD